MPTPADDARHSDGMHRYGVEHHMTMSEGSTEQSVGPDVIAELIAIKLWGPLMDAQTQIANTS